MTPDEVRRGVSRPQGFPTKNRDAQTLRAYVRRSAGGTMKIAIISDIHANLAALNAFPETDCDDIWCIGDLVGFGPRPSEVIREIRSRASVTICGNHDLAAGESVDPQCSSPFRRLAAETLEYSRRACTEEDLQFLRDLPLFKEVTVSSTRFYLVHAVPTNPLFGYCVEASDQWTWEVNGLNADILVVGHTHKPFIRVVNQTTIINPGSLGQPRTGRQEACYAVWEDGRLDLREYKYPLVETIRDIRQMRISLRDQDALISVLETGVLPFSYVRAPVEASA